MEAILKLKKPQKLPKKLSLILNAKTKRNAKIVKAAAAIIRVTNVMTVTMTAANATTPEPRTILKRVQVKIIVSNNVALTSALSETSVNHVTTVTATSVNKGVNSANRIRNSVNVSR